MNCVIFVNCEIFKVQYGLCPIYHIGNRPRVAEIEAVKTWFQKFKFSKLKSQTSTRSLLKLFSFQKVMKLLSFLKVLVIKPDFGLSTSLGPPCPSGKVIYRKMANPRESLQGSRVQKKSWLINQSCKNPEAELFNSNGLLLLWWSHCRTPGSSGSPSLNPQKIVKTWHRALGVLGSSGGILV